jgi:hypothetical protein
VGRRRKETRQPGEVAGEQLFAELVEEDDYFDHWRGRSPKRGLRDCWKRIGSMTRPLSTGVVSQSLEPHWLSLTYPMQSCDRLCLTMSGRYISRLNSRTRVSKLSRIPCTSGLDETVSMISTAWASAFSAEAPFHQFLRSQCL